MSEPRVGDITSTITKTYTITLAGCEDRQAPHSTRTYRPARLVVVKRDGNVSMVELSGPNIRKDGSASSQGTRETFYSRRDWPEWLASIIGGLA